MNSSLKYILTCICFLGILPIQAQYTTGDFSSLPIISEGLNAPGSMAMDSNNQLLAGDIGTGTNYKVTSIKINKECTV